MGELWHSNWGRIGRIVILVIATALVYSNSFGVGFHFDDIDNITQNPYIASPDKILSGQPVPESNLGEFHSRRPLGYLSFALNYKLHGLDVWGYHALNLLLHLANVLLVYALVILIFQTPRAAGSAVVRHAGTVAFMSALLFAVHPIQTQAVTYIVQRFTSMAATFYLAALVLYLQARLSNGARSRYALYAMSVLMALAAMKTKENAFTLPFTVALLDMVFFPAQPMRRRIKWLAPLLLTLLVVPLSVMQLQSQPASLMDRAMEQTRLQTDMPRSTYLFTQMRVTVTYLRLLALPIMQNLDYDYPTYESFLAPPVALSFVFLLIIFGAGLYMLRRPDGACALMGFGIAWFFLTLSVESSIFPMADVIFEHRLYLPSVGVFTAIAAGAVHISMHERRVKKTMAWFLCIACVYGIMAHNRNEVWGNSVTLWEDIVSKSQGKARPHYNLGLYYYENGHFDHAIEHFEHSRKADPMRAETFHNLGLSYVAQGEVDVAIESYHRALSIKPGFVDCMVNLASAYHQRGHSEKALLHYGKALALVPGDFDIRLSVALLHYELGQWEKAEKALLRLVASNPGSVPIKRMLIEVASKRKNLAEAN